jgi:hypothetical protein
MSDTPTRELSPTGASMTEQQIAEANAEMAGEIINEIGRLLQKLGCMCGKDSLESTPPMMYPEWIACAIKKREAEAARRAAAWQPVGTAPRDGRAVLLWWVAPVGKPAVIKSRWMCRTHCHDSRPRRCPDDTNCVMCWEGNCGGEFTHWMPLPEGPAQIDEGRPG